MRNTIFSYKILLGYILMLGGIFSLVTGQYYFFDAGTTSNYPYQQGCSETLYVKATTANNNNGASAGLFSVQFDPLHFSYYTGDTATDLQTNLFIANSSLFSSYTNPLLFPQWIDTGAKTVLHMDRYNTSSPFKGNGTYGTLLFTPKYSTTEYTGTFVIVYVNDTKATSLSYGGKNIIDSGYQFAHLTGYFYVYQQPCSNDTTPPSSLITIPIGTTKQSHLSGIHLTLTDDIGDTNVPYVRTGGGVWTGNSWGINNQYGIKLSTFQVRVSGNGTSKYFTGGMFASAGSLAAVPSDKTWQFRDRDYTVTINSSQLYDYGIEKTITITGNVRDRNNNLSSTFTKTFNAPVGPWLIPGSATPTIGDQGITSTQAVKLGIQDDWAGVNSGSIKITLSGIGGTNYGPYIFSGTDLALSGVQGTANQPDYYINISNHLPFPTSGTIQVNVYALDMAGNQDTISDYTFSTKPSCADLGCCQKVYLQRKTYQPFLYNGFSLDVLGGINPSFLINGNTGTLDCGTANQGLNLYKGSEENFGSATYLSFFDLPNLSFSGSNIQATLSGQTIYLQKIYVPPIISGCIDSCILSGGSGVTILTVDNCELPSSLDCANTEGRDDSASYYDHTCCATLEEEHGAAGCDVSDSPYDQEVTDSFQRGYDLNITNKCPITSARLDNNIIRKELAKMITMFTIHIIGIYPDTHKVGCDRFTDTSGISEEMKYFTKTACQLNLMGLEPNGNTPKKTFEPNDFVNRAQFGTILSRLIYGDTYNIHTGEETTSDRYERHLSALQQDAIMKQIQDPFMLEKRARILLMLKRTNDNSLVEKYRPIAAIHNGILSLLENVW